MNGKPIRDLVDFLGGQRVVAEGLKRFVDDVRYFNDNYEGLRRQYPDEWVAVYEQKVIGHGRDHMRLIEQLRKDGIDTGKVYLNRAYLNEKPPTLVLATA